MLVSKLVRATQPKIREILRLCMEQPGNSYKEPYASLMQGKGSNERPIRYYPNYISDSFSNRRIFTIDPEKDLIICHGVSLSPAGQSNMRAHC